MSNLGGSGPGHTTTIGEKTLTFMPWTQFIMGSYTDWFVSHLLSSAIDTAGVLRREARKLFKKATAMREQGMNLSMADEAARAALNAEGEDVLSEAQSLEFEARELVGRISDRKGQGYYHFYGEMSVDSRSQFDGRVKIAHLCLLEKQPGLKISELEMLVKNNWQAFADALREANDTKKAPAASGGSTQPQTPTTSENPCTTSQAA